LPPVGAGAGSTLACGDDVDCGEVVAFASFFVCEPLSEFVELAAGLVAAAAALYLVLAQLIFSAGWIVPVIYPMLCLLLSAIGVFAIRGRAARR